MKTRVLLCATLVLMVAGLADAQYSLTPAYPNIPPFNRPLEFRQIPDNSGRAIVIEQRGKVWVIDDNPLASTKRVVLDLSKVVSQDINEGGLLGCAFHPNYAQNHYVYFNYTSTKDGSLKSYISRFTISTSSPDSIVPSSELNLITLDQPYENHNGGCLRFGADGYLYASFGDGGSGGDPQGNGQNLKVLLGKILRLDVDHPANGKNYGIPADNPFAGNTSGYKQEIYAYGLRNTWRFGFDEKTNKLWAADVGQNVYEEIDIIEKGKNYGWNTMEGFHCYNAATCDTTGKVLPIWEYQHTNGNVSITGGYVYHGKNMPELEGKYLYSDAGTGRIWALTYDGSTPATNQQLIDRASPLISVTAFAHDADGELLVCGWLNGGSDGRLYRIVSNTTTTDKYPPVITNHFSGSTDTLMFGDVRTLDMGLKSYSLSYSQPSDSSFFKVTPDASILPCSSDKTLHRLIFEQLDPSIPMAITATIEDCSGKVIKDTIHFAAHAPIVTPPNIGFVTQGEIIHTQASIGVAPVDGASLQIDSIWIEPSGSDYSIESLSPSAATPFSLASGQNEQVNIKFEATKFGTNTAILFVKMAGSRNSIVSGALEATVGEIGAVESSQSQPLSVTVNPNPFSSSALITIKGNSEPPIVTLTDMLGKITVLPQQTTIYLDPASLGLSAGTYILSVHDKKHSEARTIIRLNN